MIAPGDENRPAEERNGEAAGTVSGASDAGDAAPAEDDAAAGAWPAPATDAGTAEPPVDIDAAPVAIDPDAAMPDDDDAGPPAGDAAAAWPVVEPAGSVWDSLQPADPGGAGFARGHGDATGPVGDGRDDVATTGDAADEPPLVAIGDDDQPLVMADDAAAPSDAEPAGKTPPDHRTVFMPPDDATAPPPSVDEPRTIFQPPTVPSAGGGASSGSDARTVFVPPTADRPATTPPVSLPPAPATPAGDQPVDGFIAGNRTFFPRRDGGGIQVGDVLNHMFEVTRYITRGGMGEVFEGLNISSGERVAIKVMLPALAADENVQGMFKREARTLTRLAHPALVQYRVMAQEPRLGVLYIVTEYIDGANLDTVLGELKPSPAEIAALGRRLADGLRVAHSLDAIHRDISPDNVMLEGGRLDRAKIIDFGIAKDLDPSNKTIIGDGFAGKLNYVAPEQLGDFGRDVGPWSDVYSLGLVLLALARGRDVDMGATMVDAVDRRRAGPDLGDTADSLRSVLAQMLIADPKLRLRSMDAVIAAFDGAASPAADYRAPGASGAAASEGSTGTASRTRLFAIVGVVVAVVAIAAVVFLLKPGGRPGIATAGAGAAAGGPAAVPSGPPDAVARQVIANTLPGIECSWIVPAVTADGGGVAIAATGAARDTAAAQQAISGALDKAGVQASSMSFDTVAPIEPGLCYAVDALRSVQSDAARLSVQQPIFEMKPRNTVYQGKETDSAPAVITLDPGPDGSNMAFFGIEQGNIQLLTGSRQAFLKAAEGNPNWTKNADGSWRILNYSFPVGLKGALLLTAPNPIDAGDLALLEKPPGGYDAAWAQRVSAVARRQGWKAEIVWYQVVDNQPD